MRRDGDGLRCLRCGELIRNLKGRVAWDVAMCASCGMDWYVSRDGEKMAYSLGGGEVVREVASGCLGIFGDVETEGDWSF